MARFFERPERQLTPLRKEWDITAGWHADCWWAGNDAAKAGAPGEVPEGCSLPASWLRGHASLRRD